MDFILAYKADLDEMVCEAAFLSGSSLFAKLLFTDNQNERVKIIS